MSDTIRPPRDGYRAISWASEVREDADRAPRLIGHFARFNTFNEINSAVEGQFLERITPGAFARTFKNNRERIRVLFQHGKDPQLGEQPIAAPSVLREDETGPYYEADLLDGIPPLVMDGLRRGQYGVSYRFQVVKEDWEPKPKRSTDNPRGLPERTIREAQVFEFGPVTFPADPGADVMVRSLSDQMNLRALVADPEHLRDLVTSIDPEALPDGPEAEPHSEGTRAAVASPTTSQKEPTPVDITQYRTRDEMAARRRELDAEIIRMAELPGVLADPDQIDWDAKNEERAALDAAITAWDARVAVAEKIAAEKPEQTVAYTPPNTFVRKTETDIFDPAVVEPFRYRSTEQWGQALRDNAMRAAEQAVFPQRTVLQDEARASVQNLLDNLDTRDKQLARRVLLTGSPIYRRAFNKLAAGQPLTAEEERGTSMVVTTDGNGGFAVPFAFDPTWLHTGAWTNINGIRANARVVQIVGTDTWQGTTVGAVTATRGAESTEQAEQGPTLTRPEILASRVSAFVSYSIEMGQDVPGLGAELASLIAEAKDVEEEAVFTVGVGGANTCLGIAPAHGTSGMYSHINASVDHTIAALDAYNLEAALPLRHRQGAAFFMNRALIRAFQAVEEDGGALFGGQYYASTGYPQNSVVGATGLTLLRYPVVESPSMPDHYAGAGDDLHMIVLLANLRASYVIVDRIGMSVEFVPHLFHADGKLPIGARGLYALWRNGAEVVNSDGGRLLSSTAA